jgi:hypothetical protein
VIVSVALVAIGLVLLVIAILRRHKPAVAAAATVGAGSGATQPESTRLDANRSGEKGHSAERTAVPQAVPAFVRSVLEA